MSSWGSLRYPVFDDNIEVNRVTEIIRLTMSSRRLAAAQSVYADFSSKDLLICYIDFRKAFESRPIWCKGLWISNTTHGSEKIIRLLESLYMQIIILVQ